MALSELCQGGTVFDQSCRNPKRNSFTKLGLSVEVTLAVKVCGCPITSANNPSGQFGTLVALSALSILHSPETRCFCVRFSSILMVNCLRFTPFGSASAAAFPPLKLPERPRSQEKDAVFSPSPALKAFALGIWVNSCFM